MSRNILEKCEVHGEDMYELSAGGVITMLEGLSYKKALSSKSKGQRPTKKGLIWPLLGGLATKGNVQKQFLLPAYSTGSLISRLGSSHISGERLHQRRAHAPYS